MEELGYHLNNDDIEEFLYCLRMIVKDIGFDVIGEKSGTGRENLYKVLSYDAKPGFVTILKILKSANIGIKFEKLDTCVLKSEIIIRDKFKDRNPLLAQLWDYEKNSSINIEYMDDNSHKNVFWLCPRNHSFKRAIISMKKNTNCPFCDAMDLIDKLNSTK